MIKIETADNGWIITDDTITGNKWLVVKDCDDDVLNPSRKTMEAFVSVLWRITDLIGPTTSRYSPHRVKISLVKGDKCENL